MPISLQQRSYHQGWSIYIFGIADGQWFCIIEAAEPPLGRHRYHGQGVTIQEAVDKAWEFAKNHD